MLIIVYTAGYRGTSCKLVKVRLYITNADISLYDELLQKYDRPRGN